MFSVLIVLLIVVISVAIAKLIKPGNSKKTGEPLKRKDLGAGFGFFIVILLALVCVTAPRQNVALQQAGLAQAAPPSSSQKQANVPAPIVITKQETESQAVPYTTQNRNDSSLAKGQTRIVQQGQDGAETLTYNVTYTNGVQTNKTLVSTVITAQPTAQIVNVGTYVAPQVTCANGTYINSVGNSVCRPETSSSAPADATARCGDGTYSFSQSRSGTCSHHGGVAEWL